MNRVWSGDGAECCWSLVLSTRSVILILVDTLHNSALLAKRAPGPKHQFHSTKDWITTIEQKEDKEKELSCLGVMLLHVHVGIWSHELHQSRSQDTGIFFKSELVLQCPIRYDTVDLAGKFIGPAFIETLNILNNCIAKM